MLTILHNTVTAQILERLRQAFPSARLLYTGLGTVQEICSVDLPAALIVDGQTISDSDFSHVATAKARYPWLVVLAIIPPEPRLLKLAYDMGGARIDGLFVLSHEDHPQSLRCAFAKARLGAVAATIESACSSLPRLLARPTLDHILAHIADLKHPAHLARLVGVTVGTLRRELSQSRLFPTKSLLARFRMQVAADLLWDQDQTVERVGLNLGYASGPAFRNACQHLLGVIPTEVRLRGGIRFSGVAEAG